MKSLSDIDTGSARVRTIGHSHEGKALEVFFLGRHGSGLKVFIISGQHGDERYAIKAAYHFIYALIKKLDFADSDISFAVLPCSNPDGASRRQRKNSTGIDLNRDHQALQSKECRAIHRFVSEWEPHLVIDMHNYPSRRKHLLKNNLVYSHDVFVDISNNPSQGTHILKETEGCIGFVRDYLCARGYSSARYTIINQSSGRARHSTYDVVDSRNSLYLKYNIPVVLIEGRQPRKADGKAGKQRASDSIYRALMGAVTWAQEHESLLRDSGIYVPNPSQIVPVGFKCKREQSGLSLDFRNAHAPGTTTVNFRKYTPHVKVTKSVSLPKAYAVPCSSRELINLLLNHGFMYEFRGIKDIALLEKLYIKSVKASKRRGRCPREIDLKSVTSTGTLENYAVFPTAQRGGRALSVYLEPESKYGLHRLSHLNLPLVDGSYYPVIRVSSQAENIQITGFENS